MPWDPAVGGRKVSGTACVLLLLLLSEPLLIEGRSGNVAFNENITVMAAVFKSLERIQDSRCWLNVLYYSTLVSC